MHIQWYLDKLHDDLDNLSKLLNRTLDTYDATRDTLNQLEEQIQTLETATVKGAS